MKTKKNMVKNHVDFMLMQYFGDRNPGPAEKAGQLEIYNKIYKKFNTDFCLSFYIIKHLFNTNNFMQLPVNYFTLIFCTKVHVICLCLISA